MSGYNVVEGNKLMIGSKATAYISSVSKSKKEQFCKDVVCFYQAACTYPRTNVMNDMTLRKNAEVADPHETQSMNFSSLKYFIDRFPILLPSDVTEDMLQMEFRDFRNYDIPERIASLRAEDQWREIGQVKDFNQNLRFPSLPRVLLGVLLIPTSNAACERIFSLVRKNKTDFRSTMGNDTLEALLINKSKGQFVRLSAEYSESVLKKCKSSTMATLNK